MSRNRLPLLIGLLVCLVAVAWLAGVFDAAPSTVDVPEVTVPAESLSRIAVQGADASFEAARIGGAWRLVQPVDAALDSALVGTFVSGLSALELASVVSTNPDRYTRFGVDSTASMLTVGWERDSLAVVVSGTGPDNQSTYVRVGDDARVFATKSRLALPASADAWREKRLWTSVAAAAVGASVRSPESEFQVQYGATGWTLIRGGEESAADSASVVRWLQRLRVVRADGFADDVSPDLVRAGATHSLSIGHADGTTHSFSLVPYGDDFAVVADGGVMTLNASRIGSFFVDPQTLVPPAE